MKIDNIGEFRHDLFSAIKECGYSVVWNYDYCAELSLPESDETDCFFDDSTHLENVLVVEDIGIQKKVFITVDEDGVSIWSEGHYKFVRRNRYKLDYIRAINHKEDFYLEFALHFVRILCS